MLIDIHVHSAISSCSVMPIEEILARSRSLGLDGVCITDHDTTAVLAQIKEGFQSDGLLVLVGMEYSTPQGDFLAYGEVESLRSGMNAPQLFDAVSRLGGAVVAAHPFRGWRPSDPTLLTHPGCSAVEVVNGRNTDAEDALAQELAAKYGLVRTAGSDAHALDELGRFPTRFNVDIASRADLVAALKAGQCEPFAAETSYLVGMR